MKVKAIHLTLVPVAPVPKDTESGSRLMKRGSYQMETIEKEKIESDTTLEQIK